LETESLIFYFDGQSAKAHPAEVKIVSLGVWRIRCSGSDLHWNLQSGELDWEESKAALRVNYGSFPSASLQVKDPSLIPELISSLRASGNKDIHNEMLTHVRKAPVLIGLVLLLLSMAFYFFALPAIAESFAANMPLSADLELGEMTWNNLSTIGMIDVDEDASIKLQSFGDELELSENYALHFHLVDSPVINAFALPGGHIVVYSGILCEMENPEQLVALLAHEAIHVDKRHSSKGIMRELSGKLFISLLIGNSSAVMSSVAAQGDQFMSLAFSRDLESEADREGQLLMQQNEIDPAGMVQLLELLADESGEVPEELEFLSSHPLTEDRIEMARKNSDELSIDLTENPSLSKLFDELQVLCE
jgi:Zn-dependent protease with chaperone function